MSGTEMDTWRIAVLALICSSGDGGVGKTALAVQFTLNCFVHTYDPTLEDGYRKQLIVDNRMCFVEVIDTAGQDEYATLRDQWIQEGEGFILVYSVGSRSTFQRLQIFRQAVRRIKRGDPTLLLVGNKCDMVADREVSREEGEALARQFGCEFIETSAKTAQNVDRVFTTLLRALRRTKEPFKLEGATPNLPSSNFAEPANKKKKKCTIL
ncbi:ras protein [Mycena metata]|uniref:Ras protein n=1 Tax=Mycena metata TaxID=1033252 RepID=A0AAD7KJ37_9AGAR|nr:ras protein [Mycena metata]